MSAATLYLPPVLSLVALSYLVALAILVTRSTDLLRGRRPLAFYEDFDGTGASVAVMRPTRQLANLFEFPVLFYAASVLLIALGLEDRLLPELCRSYAVLRWLHAASQLWLNRLWLRTPLFMAGNLVLLAIWLRVALRVLG